jgi:iron complex outermembrane receptor protein
LAAGFALVGLGGVGTVSAQQSLAGTYRSPTVTVELTSDGRSIFSGRGGSLSIGSYRVARDTITLRDERGPATCPGEAGSYLWSLDADTLRLQLLSDPCEVRRTLVAAAWARAAAGQALDAIVVTAERQTQDVQRVPVAITVVSAEQVRDAGVTRPQDLTALVPGLLVGTLNGGSAMTYMRGVGNLAAASTQDPTVTFNFDGVYIARPTSTGGLFYDLERVEVLKGPQGTLYGRNATGGAVNILPRRPKLQTRAGEVAVGYGQYNNVNVEGWLNAPLGERAAVRVAAQRVQHGAYMKDGTDDQADWAARLSVRFEPSDALSLRLGADYYDQRGHGAGTTPLGLDVDSRVGVASPEAATYYQGQPVTIAGRSWTPMPAEQRANNRHWGTHATMEWRTTLGALSLVPAIRTSDIDATGTATGNLYTFEEHSRQTSLEARLASTVHSRVRTLIGAFYFDEDIDLYSRPFNQFNVSFQRPSMSTSSVAPFGRVTFDVTNKLRATLGARLTHENKGMQGSLESFSRMCFPLPTGRCPNAQPFPVNINSAPLVFPANSAMATPVFNPADGTTTTGSRIFADTAATFARTTWRAATEYNLTERALLYASYETGFKSGGFFFSSDSKVYQPEYVGAFTLGLKSRLFAHRLQANIELFDWRYRDQQISRISLDSRSVQSLRTENVGRATIRGVETDLEYALGADTQLSANVQYLDATYDSYAYATPISTGRPISGCDVAPTQSGFAVDCSGRQAPYAPEWTFALGAAQTFELPRGARLVARTRTRYQSETMAGLDFLQQQQQDGYWMVDASLTLATIRDRYSVGVFGQNVTDQTIVTNTFVVPFSTFAVGVLRPPRTFGVRVSAGF